MNRSALLPAMLALPCHAGLLVHEPFDYSDGLVTGLSGGTGWSGPWSQDGGSCLVTAGSLGYLDGALRELVTAGGSLDTAGPDTTRSFRTVSSAPLGDVWISFLWRLPASNSLYEGVNFYLGGESIFAVSNASSSADPTITLNHFATGGNAVADGGGFGDTRFIVLHLIEGGGTNGGDRVEMFLDPSLTGPETGPDAVIQGTDFGFDRVRVAGQSGASLFIDELRIGDQFADIAPFLPPESDPDGDGLPTAVELELGLDPNVSDAALIEAISDHPEIFDLHDLAGIRELAAGGVVLEGVDGNADLMFEIQQSTDLSTWLPFETVRRTIVLPPDKSFLRFRAAAPAAR